MAKATRVSGAAASASTTSSRSAACASPRTARDCCSGATGSTTTSKADSHRWSADRVAGAKLERTRWPGIYRRGNRFVYEWTDAHGDRRRRTVDTREEASKRKAQEEANAARG